MRRTQSNSWDSSGGVVTVDSYPLMSTKDMTSSYVDGDTQEWTNEDLAETTQAMQTLEKIVKAHDIDLDPTFSSAVDRIHSPSSNPFRGGNSTPLYTGQQIRQQYTQRIDDYEPHEGKDSIFDDIASGRGSTPSLSRGSSNSSCLAHDDRPPKSPATRREDNDAYEFQSGKSRGKGITDPNLSDAVERASSKLREFQKKITRTIENSPEEVTLSMLLELNESVNSVLSKADVVISAPGHPSQPDFPSILTIMYMLRRGSRVETLTAVKQLAMLCLGAESYIDITTKVVLKDCTMKQKKDAKDSTMKQIKDAEALQVLMTALVRCTALLWPEVEMQICRVITVLVTYEEDWSLLQKNSLEILTALQSLLLKSPRNPEPSDHLQPGLKTDNCCDVYSLVAAAIAKLSLVLCVDWGKAAVPTAAHVSTTRTSEVERAQGVLRASADREARRVDPVPATDPRKTLEIVLIIILTMCDGAMVVPLAVSPAGVCESSPVASEGLSVAEALTRSLSLLSNSSAVLCSIALCNLAECPQCVALLVQGGALRLLRCWFELSTDLMIGVMEALRKEKLQELDNNDAKSMSRVLRSKEYVQAFELLTNAAAAVHYLVGGSDIPGDKNLPATDSTAGFIYAQVMAEGLPAAMVRLISASVCDFTNVRGGDKSPSTPPCGGSPVPGMGYNIDTDRDNLELIHLIQSLPVTAALAAVGAKEKKKGSKKRVMAHILPRAAEGHISQTLYQLSSRVQSRAHLQAVGAPFALCRLFVSATERSKGLTSPRPPPLLSTVSEKRRWDEDDDDDDDGDDRRPLTPSTPSSGNIKISMGIGGSTDNDEDMGNDYFTNAFILQYSMDNNCKTGTQSPSGNSTDKQQKKPAEDVLAKHDIMYLKTVSSSCLDALTNFLADDLALRLRSRSHSAAEDPGKSVVLGLPSTAFTLSSKSPLTEVMAHKCLLGALKFVISSLPQCKARLAALRTIASLTDWPLALAGMIELEITTELVRISQHQQGQGQGQGGQPGGTGGQSGGSTHGTPSAVTPRTPRRGSSFLRLLQSPRSSGTSSTTGSASTSERTKEPPGSFSTSTPKVMKMSRCASADSDQGMDNEFSYGNGRNCSIGGDQSPVCSLIRSSIISHSMCDNSVNNAVAGALKDFGGDPRLKGVSPGKTLRRPSCSAEGVFGPELITEETMCLCFSLANAATFTDACAVSLFNLDLMSAMLRIATSSNLEIVRQALKCVGAMCLVKSVQSPIAHNTDQRLVDVKAKQLRTQTFSRALGTLTGALSSPSSLVQLEAVRGIANIARVDEQMCDQAVAGSLRTIISMLLDASCDRDTRNAAEDVLKAVGFIGGMRDLEVCQFDVELLGEWFTIKKSMPPQMLARRLVAHWIEDLFNGAQPVPVVINSSTVHSIPPNPSPACPLMSWGGSAPSSANNSRSGSPVLGRSQNLWNLGGSSSGIINPSGTTSRGAKAEKTLLQTAKTELQRRFTDSISKFVPFCMGGSASRVLREEEEEDQEMRESGLDLFSPHAGSNTSNPYGLYEGMDCPPDGVLNLMDIFYASHLQQVLLMDMVSFLSDPVLESLITWNRPEYYDNSLDEINAYDSDNEQGNDAELLRTQQGLRHIGPKGEFDRTSARLSLPIPFSLNALLLPMRCYVSFTRVGRVIERIVEQGGDLQPFSLVFRDSLFEGDSHASLLSTLRRCGRIVTLSVANYKNTEIERDSRMGWLVGNLPPSIRFVSLRNIVATESIQTLCILLRKQNLSFLEAPQSYPWSYNNPDPLNKINPGPQPQSALPKTLKQNLQDEVSAALLLGRSCHPLGLQGIAITHCTVTQADVKYICDLLEPVTAFRRSSNTPRSHVEKERERERDRGDDSTTSSKDTNNTKSTPGRPRGLRYLDLGFNRIGCTNCSEILRAAARGDLECLNLAGNFSHRGLPFLSAIAETLLPNIPVACSVSGRSENDDSSSDGNCSDDGAGTGTGAGAGKRGSKGTSASSSLRSKHHNSQDVLSLHLPKQIPLMYTCHLKHLGISYNSLSSRVFCGILSCLERNSSLGSLDVSHNGLNHSSHVKLSVRQFLRLNRGIRTLDLSHNKFTAETTNAIHLGLLENDVLLLLPLIGNSSAERSAELSLVQTKLRENRVRYKAQIDLFNVQADEQERAQKARRKDEEDRRATKEAEAEQAAALAALAALKETITVAVADITLEEFDYPMVVSPPPTPPEPATKTPSTSVQFAPQTSIIPSASISWDKSSSVDSSTPVPDPSSSSSSSSSSSPSSTLSPSSSSIRGSFSQENEKLLITFGTFPAVHLSPSPKTVLPANEQSGLIINRSVPPLAVQSGSNGSHGIPNEVVPALTPQVDPPELRRTSSLLRPKSMGYILDQQASRTMQLQQPSIPVMRRKKEKNVLNVLFSAPLAWRDRSNRLHPLEMLDYGAERDALSHVFREVQRDISVIYDFATTDTLRTALSFGCRALHFSGHGHESHLNFEDGRSGLQLVNVETLRNLLSAGGLRLDFVFVSACHSKPTGQAFVDAGVKHVVCVKIEAMIQDSSAMAFTRAFYLALLSGQTVKHSFLIAKEALKASPCIADSVLEGEKFVLLPENEPHDVPIFLSSHVLEWVTPTNGNSHIPSPPPDFEGREVDMHRIITTLLARRLVSVVGAVGQGKSSLTAAVVTYMNDRKTMFEDGVVYLKPHGSYKLVNHRAFLSALLAAISSGPAAVAARLHEQQKDTPGGDLTGSGALGRFFGQDNDENSGRNHENLDIDVGVGVGAGVGSEDPDPVYLVEDLIMSVLSPFKLLLVLDHIEGLLSNTVSDTATDLKIFVGRLIERCRHVKVLVVAGEVMGMGKVSGVVENPVSVGPLSLRSSLRLFARLAPALSTSQRKASFVSALMPAKPDVTVHCRELTLCSMKLLALFGNGNPSSIVKLACESSLESVEKIMAEGVDIIFTIEGNAGDVVRRRTVSATPLYVLPSSPAIRGSE